MSVSINPITYIIVLIALALLFLFLLFFLLYVLRRRQLLHYLEKINYITKKISYYNVPTYFTKISKVAPFDPQYKAFYERNNSNYLKLLLPQYNKLKNDLQGAIDNYETRSHDKGYYEEVTKLFNHAKKLNQQYLEIINECKKILKFQVFSRTMIVYLRDRFQKIKYNIQNKNYQLFLLTEPKLNEKIAEIQDLFAAFEIETAKLNKLKMEATSNKIKQSLSFLEICSKKLPGLINLIKKDIKNKLSNLEKSYKNLVVQKYNLSNINFNRSFGYITKDLQELKQLTSQLKLEDAENLSYDIANRIHQLEQKMSLEIVCYKLIRSNTSEIKSLVVENINLCKVLRGQIELLKTDYIFDDEAKTLISKWTTHQKINVDLKVLDKINQLAANFKKISPANPYSFYAKKIFKIVAYLKVFSILNQRIWIKLLKMYATEAKILNKTSYFYNEYNLLIAAFLKYNKKFINEHDQEFIALKNCFDIIDKLVRKKPIDLDAANNQFSIVQRKIIQLKKINETMLVAKNDFKTNCLKVNAVNNKTEELQAFIITAKTEYKAKNFIKANNILKQIIVDN